jgi:hypothetical protein
VISPQSIKKAVDAVGRAVAARQSQADWQPEFEKLSESMQGAQGTCTLELGLDGAIVPLNSKPKEEPFSHKEARSLSLRLKDNTGKLLSKLIISRLTDLGSFLVSIGSLIDECRDLQITAIVLAGDGARWIWEFAKKAPRARFAA